MTAPMTTQMAPWAADAAWPVRKSAVSTPSRMTATKASTANAVSDPSSSARSTAAWSCPFTFAAWRRIQKSIQVTTAAASRSVAASKICSYGFWKLPTVRYSPTPMTALRPIARPAPRKTVGKERALPVLAR